MNYYCFISNLFIIIQEMNFIFVYSYFKGLTCIWNKFTTPHTNIFHESDKALKLDAKASILKLIHDMWTHALFLYPALNLWHCSLLQSVGPCFMDTTPPEFTGTITVSHVNGFLVASWVASAIADAQEPYQLDLQFAIGTSTYRATAAIAESFLKSVRLASRKNR